mgnify:FL=1
MIEQGVTVQPCIAYIKLRLFRKYIKLKNMIHIIYMAAGNSRRFGSNKLLHIWQGKMLYRHTLDMLSDIVSSRKINEDINYDITLTVVTQYDRIIADLDGRKDINTVFCGDSRLGASYTIKAGINSLMGRLKKDDWLLFIVADQPYLSEKTILKFIEAAEKKKNKKEFSSQDKKSEDYKLLLTNGEKNNDDYENILSEEKKSKDYKVFSARYREKAGNPCMFSCGLIPELLMLRGDSGGRKVAKRHECFYIDVEDEKELFDIDSEKDINIYSQD